MRLSRSGNFAFDSKIIQKRDDFAFTKDFRMSFAVEKDVMPDPVTIAFFSSWTEMTSSAGNCYAFKQAGRTGWCWGRGLCTPLGSLLSVENLYDT